MVGLLEAGIFPDSLETSSEYWEPCFEASALRMEVAENNLFLHLQFDASGPLVQDVSPTKPVLDTKQSFNVVFSSDWSSDRFTGKPYSSSTGLYYDYQRWYDPVSGRFLSPDPLRGRLSSPQSLNPYTYVLNIPTVLKDPTGRGYSYDENRAVQTGAFWKLVEGDEAATVRLRGTTIASYNENVVTAQPVNTATFWENVGSTGIGTRGLVSTASFWDEAEGSLRFPAVSGAQGSGYKFVSTPNGYLVRVPANWESRIANNRLGLVVQDPAVDPASNANMIRIMDPTTRYPQGYVVYHNELGQPMDIYGRVSSGPAATHIPLDYTGPVPGWP